MEYKVVWPSTQKHYREYLAGLIAGDGQFEQKRITITDSSREFLERNAEKMLRFLGLKPRIHARNNTRAYYLRIYGTDIVREFRKLVVELKSKPTINFIRGFFDAEGTILVEQGKYVVIEISQRDAPLLANLAVALRDRCIYPYIKYQAYYDHRPSRMKTYTRYVLRIKRKSSVYRFLNKVGLRHPKHISEMSRLRPL